MTGLRATTRLASIDVLRTLAIVLMTLVHFVENLAGSASASRAGPFIGANRYWWMPTGFAAPLFTFLSGVSYRLWADAQTARGRDRRNSRRSRVRRGLFLILLGFAFNVLIWMPEDIFNWDILTLIGTAMLALDWPAARARRRCTLVACGLLVGLAPALRAWPTTPPSGNGLLRLRLHPLRRRPGFLVTGYFPRVPWLVFPLAGFLLAPLIFPEAAAAAPRTPPASRLPGAVATARIVVTRGRRS